MKRFCETWAIPHERIVSYFNQLDGVYRTDNVFCYKAVHIHLNSLPPRKLGPITVPQTCVEISGPDKNAGELHHAFVMQFLSAGG